jgi:putative transposase
VRGRFSEAQILGFLREAAAGTSVMELCWNHCFSCSTFRAWKAKYGEAIDAETGRLTRLEFENARLQTALARSNSDPGGVVNCLGALFGAHDEKVQGRMGSRGEKSRQTR